VVIGVLAVVLAAGCANGRNDDASEASGGQVAADAGGVGGGGGEVAAAEPAGALDPRAVVRPSAQLAGAERSVIRTAELRVEVDDVPGASERALAVVEAAGGFLSGQRGDLSGNANAVLTFKVPPDAFLDALGDLADLGDLVERPAGGGAAGPGSARRRRPPEPRSFFGTRATASVGRSPKNRPGPAR
jgi:hypothetical protein